MSNSFSSFLNRPYPKTNPDKEDKLSAVSSPNLSNNSLPFLNEEDEYNEKKEEILSKPNNDANDLGKFLAGKKSKENPKLDSGIQFPPRPKSVEPSRQIDKRTQQFARPQSGILRYVNNTFLI